MDINRVSRIIGHQIGSSKSYLKYILDNNESNPIFCGQQLESIESLHNRLKDFIEKDFIGLRAIELKYSGGSGTKISIINWMITDLQDLIENLDELMTYIMQLKVNATQKEYKQSLMRSIDSTIKLSQKLFDDLCEGRTVTQMRFLTEI